MILLRLIAPLLLIILAWWGLRRVRQQYSLTASQFRWLAGGTAAVGLIVVLIIAGRLPVQALVAPLVFLATFALRNLNLLAQLWSWRNSRRRADKTGARGGTSSIRTSWLTMELAHASGVMDGEVLKGRYRGQRLSAMDLAALLVLAQECSGDTDSLQLLEAYLDRTHADWREQTRQGDRGASANARSSHDSEKMSEGLALEILGLEKGAARDQIVAAHRRLMQKLHPDRGGSDYLAQRINAARDFLLARLKL